MTISIKLPPEVTARLARAWRAAAETSKQQFPDDEKRYRYYIKQAEHYEHSEHRRSDPPVAAAQEANAVPPRNE